MTSTKPEKTLEETQIGVPMTQDGVEPTDQQRNQLLSDQLLSPTKRVALLLTGSFNPVTVAHLRMLELARDYYHLQSIQVVEGILSPVSDNYNKPGLAKVNYRIEMLQAAIRNDHWLRVDTWEANQPSWTRTKLVLDHHYDEIKKRYGENTQLRLVSGTDVALSMLDPAIWLPQDIEDIMKNYGLACITRLNSPEPGKCAIAIPDVKEEMPDRWKQHIDIIQDWIINDISATNIRNRLAKGCSVKYVVPDATIELIRQYGLYNSNKSICLADWPGKNQQQKSD